MREFCHRCGGELHALASDGWLPFCPHCGAPQLLLSEYSEPLSTANPASFNGPSAGTLPPPRPNHVDWNIALSSAAIVGSIAAALSAISARNPNLSPISTIWIVSASLTTLAIYQRRRPLASMNAGVGAKIGMLVGLVLAACLGGTLAIGITIARYVLHSLSSFDADMTQAMRAQVQQLAASRPVPPESLALINSLQFRTTMMLTGVGLLLFFVLLISIFGGAVGGLIRTRRISTKA